MARRLALAKKEMSYKRRYDHRIVNDRLDAAYAKWLAGLEAVADGDPLTAVHDNCPADTLARFIAAAAAAGIAWAVLKL